MSLFNPLLRYSLHRSKNEKIRLHEAHQQQQYAIALRLIQLNVPLLIIAQATQLSFTFVTELKKTIPPDP